MRIVASLVRLVLVVASLNVAACVTTPEDTNFTWVDDLKPKQLEAPQFHIQRKDKLQVTVFKQESLSGEVLVRDDGGVTMPLIGDVQVVGLTPTQAAEEVTKRLASTGFIDKPSVSVAVIETRTPTIAVIGEVKQPATFDLRNGTTVLDAIALAGGLSEFANKHKVFVIRKAENNLRIRFDYEKLTRSEGLGMKFVLQDGDVIVCE